MKEFLGAVANERGETDSVCRSGYCRRCFGMATAATASTMSKTDSVRGGSET